ncbi:hypothetical protein QX204_24400 [Nocardia sp. PE-7]|uniref:hypothetical protein n=1 Tax=Nocardia sp. PE-7 TaxID=3058426 RepID=UPI0026586891|nr:hypothetical protein [Nocardia sp. PE-7]WKG08185.1 hypothetical protein QX204_24400 [Nocardia sp. PE-7]
MMQIQARPGAENTGAAIGRGDRNQDIENNRVTSPAEAAAIYRRHMGDRPLSPVRPTSTRIDQTYLLDSRFRAHAERIGNRLVTMAEDASLTPADIVAELRRDGARLVNAERQLGRVLARWADR